MVLSIEQIKKTFAGLERPTGNRWNLHTIAPGRLHLSVGHDGAPTVFIEGEATSFGRLQAFRGVEHRDDAVDVRTGNLFKALRVTAPDEPYGNEALAIIAYEIARTIDSEPDSDNTTLLASVTWILRLLGVETSILSVERQRGLVAELLLLRRLCQIGRDNGISPNAVLDRWWGPVGGKRDVAAAGVSIEVKVTALNTRTHHIASIDKLEPTSLGERVYLYSVGVKSEPTVDRKLPTYVADAVSEIVDANGMPVASAVHAYYEKLESTGYQRQFDDLYTSEPGLVPNPLLTSELYSTDDLDHLRISSFKGDRPPSMVTAVSHEITIPASAPALAQGETDVVLLSLITSPAV